MIELDAFTGLRRGELIGLRWEDVDLEELTLHVRRSVVAMVEGSPKTEASLKDVPLDAQTAESLWAWKERSPLFGARRLGICLPTYERQATLLAGMFPSYVRHRLSVPASTLAALRERGALAFADPLAITRDRTIIDGYARWELAKETGRMSLPCIEYELSEAEALQWFLQRHARSTGPNAFTRIILALDLESSLTEKARSNQQMGGRHKGWSNLTKAEEIHGRSKVAQAAGVSVGNVTKVKQLKDACVPEYIEALRSLEISIHWAWKQRNAATDDQLDALGQKRKVSPE